MPEVRIELGFLYDAYYEHYWWFELADMMNKLFMTSIIAFFTKPGQLQIALAFW